MAQAARRTQSERRHASEQALLAAAIEIIATRGVGSLTFEALAETGGFSRGLVSARFGNKARLIEAVLNTLHERHEATFRHEEVVGKDGLDAILSYVELALADMATRKEARAYYVLLSSSLAEVGDSRSFFAATHETVRQRLEDWVRAGQESGTIRTAIDPASAAMMIGCMMFGSAMQYLVDASVNFDALRRSSLAMLRSSLGSSV